MSSCVSNGGVSAPAATVTLCDIACAGVGLQLIGLQLSCFCSVFLDASCLPAQCDCVAVVRSMLSTTQAYALCVGVGVWVCAGKG